MSGVISPHGKRLSERKDDIMIRALALDPRDPGSGVRRDLGLFSLNPTLSPGSPWLISVLWECGGLPVTALATSTP